LFIELSGDQTTENVTVHDSDENVNVTSASSNNTTGSNTVEDKNDVYAEEYFSSGSDDEHLVGGQASKSKERRKVLTNDELFYDPDMDDEDEQWVIKQRQDHRKKGLLSNMHMYMYCLKLSLRGKFGREMRIWDELADKGVDMLPSSYTAFFRVN